MPKIAGKNIPYEDKPKFKGQNPAAREASKMGQELEYIPLNSIESEFPITNALERSQTSPDVTEYKDGGKIEDWKEEGYEWSTNELKRRVFAQERGTDVTDLVKLRSRRKKEVEKAKKGKKK